MQQTAREQVGCYSVVACA